MTGGVLASLSDVQGVVGAFFVGPGDMVTESSMPAYFDAADIEDLAPRLRAVLSASSEIGLQGEVDHCVLRYRDYHLHVRREQPGQLCILTEPHANVPALRMACRLVAKRISRSPDSARTPSSQSSAGYAAGPRSSGTHSSGAHSSGAYSPFPPRISAPPVPPRPTPPSPSSQQATLLQTPLPLELDLDPLSADPISVAPVTLPSSHRAAAPEARGMPQATGPGQPKIIVYRGRRYQV